MNQTTRKILIFLFIIFSFTTLNAQNDCFENLGEVSGIDLPQLASDLNTEACDLVASLPLEYQSQFKVFDFGFYALSDAMDTDINTIWENTIIKAQSKSTYYLLIGKVSGKDGIYNSFFVDLKLPPIIAPECVDNLGRRISKIKSILNDSSSPFNYLKKSKDAMQSLQNVAVCEICDNYDEDGNPIDDDGDGFANCDDFDCLYLQISSQLRHDDGVATTRDGCAILTSEELDIFTLNEEYIVSWGYESSADVLEEIEAIGGATCMLGASISVLIGYGAYYISDHLVAPNYPPILTIEAVDSVFSKHKYSIMGDAVWSCGESIIPVTPKVKRYLNYAESVVSSFIDAVEVEYNKHDDGQTGAYEIITEKMNWGNVLVKASSGTIISLVLKESVSIITPRVTALWASNKGRLIDKFDQDFRDQWQAIRIALGLSPPDGMADAIRSLKQNIPHDKWNNFLDDFGNSIDDLQFFMANILDRVKAWKGLFNTPPSVRTNTFNLETVSRHLDDTGKLADDVAAEIAQSGSYAKWLSDKLVTYIKNGHKITKNTIDDAFEHINGVKLNGAGNPTYNNTQGIVGAHNLDAFNGQTVANGGRIEIVNNASTSVNGVNKIEYKVLAADSGGNPIPGQYFANGSVFNKTTFDPAIYDPTTMKSIGYDGYKNAIDNGSFGSARSFSGTSGNYPVAGHYKEVAGENVISTWWIDAN